MRLRSIVGLLLALPLVGCDHASPPSAKTPGPGVLRLTRAAAVPPEIAREAAYRPGLPQLGLTAEYAGPKPRVRFIAEGFERGKPRAKTEDSRAVGLPFTGEIAFALGEDRNSEGKLLAAILERRPGTSSPDTGSASTRSGGVTQRSIEPIGTRKWNVYAPRWPLDVADGNEIVVWGVFVGEPPDSKEDMPLLDRARNAESAWLFKVSTSEHPKE